MMSLAINKLFLYIPHACSISSSQLHHLDIGMLCLQLSSDHMVPCNTKLENVCAMQTIDQEDCLLCVCMVWMTLVMSKSTRRWSTGSYLI